MSCRTRVLLALAIFLAGPGFLLHFGGGAGGGGGGGGAVALVRTFNNPGGSATGSTAFWSIGQPFKPGEVPTGDTVTATLGGTAVPATCAERKFAANGDLEWCHLLVDFSGAPVGAGGTANLQLTAASGTWCDAQGTNTCPSGFSKSSWDALGDVVTLSSVTNAASSSAVTVEGSGTWNAKFDGGIDDIGDTGTETVLADTPQGREVKVAAYLWDTATIANFTSASYSSGTHLLTASFSSAVNINSNDGVILNTSGGQLAVCSAFNGNPIAVSAGSEGAATAFTCSFASDPGASSVTSISAINRNIQVVMYYWSTCKAVGTVCTTAGPVESWGPFVENSLIYPKNPPSPYHPNSTTTSYSYNLEYDRGATKIRGNSSTCGSTPANFYCGLTLYALTIHPVVRADGQGDWWIPGTGAGDDPGIYVTQDYGLVVNTKKIPPYVKGVTYLDSTTAAVGIITKSLPLTANSGAILTHPNYAQNNVLGGSGYLNPTAIDFLNVGSLTGIQTGVIYVANPASGTGGLGFCLYDTMAHAMADSTGACNGTGLITPGGTFTNAVFEDSAAPMTIAAYTHYMENTGSRPDLGIAAEWSVAYLVGNTVPWQRLGRVMAYDYTSYPEFALDASTGHIACLIDAQGTAGSADAGCPATSGVLGTGYSIDSWANTGNSADINSGTSNAGGIGIWQPGDNEHAPNSIFLIWVMEGAPFLRDFSVVLGDAMLANTSVGQRNQQVQSSNSKWYGIVFAPSGASIRAAGWTYRDVADAAFAAPNGSREEAYFRTLLTTSIGYAADYQAYKGTNYTALGWQFYDEDSHTSPIPPNNIQNQELEEFETSFFAGGLAWAQLLEGDYVTTIVNQTAQQSKWLNYFWNTNLCQYYATAYVFIPGTSGFLASSPGSYVSGFGAVGLNSGSGAYTSFTGPGSPTVTSINSAQPFPWTLVAGDEFRMYNYDTSGAAVNVFGPAPPPPFVIGQTYIIINPNNTTHTFNLSTDGVTPINVGSIPDYPGVSASLTTPGEIIFPTANNSGNNYYAGIVSVVNAKTGSGGEPNWSTAAPNIRNTVIDGQVQWINMGTVIGNDLNVATTISGAYVPTGQTQCPTVANGGSTNGKNSMTGTPAGNQSYLINQIMAMALSDEVGTSGMHAAWTNGWAAWTAASGDCSQGMLWCMQAP